MDSDKQNLIAQWAFDTRAVLLRFHLWLEDVEVERRQAEPVSARAFTPRSIARSLALTSAATALGTRLFGQYGAGRGTDKRAYNMVKKAADAISAYIMSEGLWHLTRSLPENHAIMVCLGEGLMPKAGETPEMGANPLLGFGRVYARAGVARIVDEATHKMLNEGQAFRYEHFLNHLRQHGITLWGAAVDTLENTSRFAEGKTTGPMSVIHLFDQPLTVSRPYEAYFGTLTVPRAVAQTAEAHSVLLDWATPRARLLQLIEATYPGVHKKHVHVWTLAGESRSTRLSDLWAEWRQLGVHLVEDGWIAPTGLPVFTDSGTYAPVFLVKDWVDEKGARHVFLCDGYAATAEAMQAASLSEVLDIHSTMTVLSPTFTLPHHQEYAAMRLMPSAEDFTAQFNALKGTQNTSPALAEHYRNAIVEAQESNIPMQLRTLQAADFVPEKRWSVLACIGSICDDPYTGMKGVEDLGAGRYRVVTQLATHAATSRISFVLRLQDSLEQSKLVFSPLLVRFMAGEDYKSRPVRTSDSGRIRNELQTLISQALEFEGDDIRVCFERIDEKVLPDAQQELIKDVLSWYKKHHPVWFSWLRLS